MTARGQPSLAPAGTSCRRKRLERFGFCLLALLPGILGAGIPSPAASGAEFAALVRSADKVFIEYRDASGDRTAQITDPAWIAQLAEIVDAGPLIPRSYCFCVSSPKVRLYREGVRLVVLSVHHNKIRSFGRVNNDFEVGPERTAALVKLFMASFASSQPHFAPPRIKSEKAAKPAVRPHPVQVSLPSEPLWLRSPYRFTRDLTDRTNQTSP